jgi:hypothetical protein
VDVGKFSKALKSAEVRYEERVLRALEAAESKY